MIQAKKAISGVSASRPFLMVAFNQQHDTGTSNRTSEAPRLTLQLHTAKHQVPEEVRWLGERLNCDAQSDSERFATVYRRQAVCFAHEVSTTAMQHPLLSLLVA